MSDLALIGRLSCGCCAAVDLDPDIQKIDEYRGRGYEVELINPDMAIAEMRETKIPNCGHPRKNR